MIELVGGIGAIIGGVALASSKSKMSDRKKIKKIFENQGLGIMENGKPKFPRFIRSGKIEDNKKVIGTDYVYQLPLGYPSKKMEVMNEGAGIFEDGLNKRVKINYDGMLHVKVYEEDIPEKWDFKDIELTYGSWHVPLGRTFEGVEWYDFDKFPHMLNAGSTRFGKTVLLKMLMTSLILQNPDDVEFYIIDLKGGLEFDKYKNLMQVKGVASTPREAYDMLGNFNELQEGTIAHSVVMRSMFFKKNGWSNIVNTPMKKRTFIIVDEAHQLVSEKWMDKKDSKMLEACMHTLQSVASVGGGLGYRLLYCTQYPTADACPKNIKQNSTLRISFKLPDPHASSVILGDKNGEASELPNIQGRAIMKTHEMKEIQVPYISDKFMKSVTKIYESLDFEVVNADANESTEKEDSTGKDIINFG